MADRRTEVFSIQFDPEAVVMAYMNVPNDVRVQGMVGLQHQIRIDLAHPDYAEDAAALQHAARAMLRNALEDFHSSEPWEPDPDDPDDDERGMGDG